ncbi:MAG: hypothetical protein NAOJABEB_00747 [Steroidobacteraceae bacterium]|nr:hypothetical protein [Steroidobacteraceae bacterium]
MPRFSVTMHIRGPFLDGTDAEVMDGAYTRRFVTAENATSACTVALEALRSEASFLAFQALPENGLPRVDVEAVRPAKWYESLRSGRGYIFYGESNEAKVGNGSSPNESLERSRER